MKILKELPFEFYLILIGVILGIFVTPWIVLGVTRYWDWVATFFK